MSYTGYSWSHGLQHEPEDGQVHPAMSPGPSTADEPALIVVQALHDDDLESRPASPQPSQYGVCSSQLPSLSPVLPGCTVAPATKWLSPSQTASTTTDTCFAAVNRPTQTGAPRVQQVLSTAAATTMPLPTAGYQLQRPCVTGHLNRANVTETVPTLQDHLALLQAFQQQQQQLDEARQHLSSLMNAAAAAAVATANPLQTVLPPATVMYTGLLPPHTEPVPAWNAMQAASSGAGPMPQRPTIPPSALSDSTGMVASLQSSTNQRQAQGHHPQLPVDAAPQVKALVQTGGHFASSRQARAPQTYVGGETRLVGFSPAAGQQQQQQHDGTGGAHAALMSQLAAGSGWPVNEAASVKYQLPGSQPAQFVDLRNDTDVANMWEAWQEHVADSSNAHGARQKTKLRICVEQPALGTSYSGAQPVSGGPSTAPTPTPTPTPPPTASSTQYGSHTSQPLPKRPFAPAIQPGDDDDVPALRPSVSLGHPINPLQSLQLPYEPQLQRYEQLPTQAMQDTRRCEQQVITPAGASVVAPATPVVSPKAVWFKQATPAAMVAAGAPQPTPVRAAQPAVTGAQPVATSRNAHATQAAAAAAAAAAVQASTTPQGADVWQRSDTAGKQQAPFCRPIAKVPLSDVQARLEVMAPEDLKIVRFLGAGGFGEVYLCKWNGNDVAVKCLNPSLLGTALDSSGCSTSAQATADLLREAMILGNLRHPNIVWVFGIVLPKLQDNARPSLDVYGVSADAVAQSPYVPGMIRPPALVTEFMAGGSVRAALNRHAAFLASPATRLKLALDAARGMEYLHNRNIVHFDLKAANLLIGWRDALPVVKVADFGLSKQRQETYVSGITSLRGTLPWTAPEIIKTPKAVTEKVDVYSFGITLWELWTGRAPYDDLNYHALLHQMTTLAILRPPLPGSPDWEGEPIPELAPGFIQLMQECWAEQPANRPSFSALVPRLQVMLQQASRAQLETVDRG